MLTQEPRPHTQPDPQRQGDHRHATLRPDWEGHQTHTFGRLEEIDTGLDLGPIDALLVWGVLHHQLEQLHGDDVVIVCRTKRVRALSPPPGMWPMPLPAAQWPGPWGRTLLLPGCAHSPDTQSATALEAWGRPRANRPGREGPLLDARF